MKRTSLHAVSWMKRLLPPLFLIIFACAGGNDIRYELPAGSPRRITLGIEDFIRNHAHRYRGKTAVLVTNHSGVDFDLRHNISLLRQEGIIIPFVLAPEHGLYGYQNYYDRRAFQPDDSYDLVVYNMHHFNAGEMASMCSIADLVIFDMQDMGMRCYTYISSLKMIMDALSGSRRELIVLDRPNPIAFLGVDGPYLDRRFFSAFISAFPSPFIYDMTIGEAARYYNGECAKNVRLTVVPMRNYRRSMLFNETSLPWVPPSPNLPAYRSAIVYTSVVLLEGITLSIGRGTPNPFEYLGAPWIEPRSFSRDLNALNLKGFRFRPVYFEPTFSHYSGKRCGGVQMFYTGGTFSPVETSYRLIQFVKSRYSQVRWIKNGNNSYIVDNLAGTDLFRKFIDEGKSYSEFSDAIRGDIRRYAMRRSRYLLY